MYVEYPLHLYLYLYPSLSLSLSLARARALSLSLHIYYTNRRERRQATQGAGNHAISTYAIGAPAGPYPSVVRTRTLIARTKPGFKVLLRRETLHCRVHLVRAHSELRHTRELGALCRGAHLDAQPKLSEKLGQLRFRAADSRRAALRAALSLYSCVRM